MADETVRVTVTGNSGPFISEMNKASAATTRVEKSAQALNTQMMSMAKGFGVAAAATVATQQLKESVTMAINLQDSISKVGVVFGDAAGEINAFADDTSRSFGLTKTAALDATSTFAIFGKAAGLAGGDLTKFSEDLTQRAVDLKSFFGGDVQQAIGAIGSALRGEAEPIRAYGVLLDDATLKARALTMGLIDNTKNALDPQTRALAAAAEIMAQTSDAQGDYMRTQDGAANSIQNFNVALGRMKEIIGTELLPSLTPLIQAGTAITEALAPIMPALLGMAGGFSMLKGTFDGSIEAAERAGQTFDIYGNAVDLAATSTGDMGAAASGASGGVDALGAAAGSTTGYVQQMADATAAALAELNGFIDARQSLLGAQRGLRGIGADIRSASRQPRTSGGGGGGRSGESEAESKARQKVIDKIREQDQAEVNAEIKRARRRAQRKADAAADKSARADTQAGVAGAIATDKAARRGEDIDGSNQRGTVGEATGTISKAQQKKLDKEIEGIRARHKKALDAQLKGLEKAQGAAKGAASAVDTYSTSLSENTEAGRRNLDQLDRGADAIQAVGQAAYDEAIKQGKGAEEAGRLAGVAMLKAREDLLAAYSAAGFARKEVEAYLRKLGLIPEKITTTIKVKVDTTAMDAAVRKYGPGPGKVWNPNLGAWIPGGTPEPAPTKSQPAGRFAKRRAGGGEIHGPGSGTSDSVPIWASAGEYMVNASQYAANRDLVRAINAGSGPVSGGGMTIGAVNVTESSGSRVRASVIDALAETAYRTGAVR